LFNVLSDWKDIPVSIKVSYVYFHHSRALPKWDGTSQAKTTASDREATYCVLGSTKGEIFFVDIENRSHYYTKVYFHTTEISFIRQISSPSSDIFFCSMSKDKQMVVWKLSFHEAPSALVTLSYNRDFTYQNLFGNYLMLGEKSGELNIIQLMAGTTLTVRKSTSTGGHIRAVICGDYMNNR
jgi:hypothetical protein